MTSSEDGDITQNNGVDDLWIFKIDREGDLKWQQNYGGSSFDIATDIEQTSDNGFIVAGISSSLNGDITNHINIPTKKNFLIYPNPTTGLISLDIIAAKNSTSYLINNSLGQTVKSGNVDKRESQIDVSNLVSGHYFLQLLEAENKLESRTFYKK